MTPERWQRVKLLFARALDHPADDRVRVVIESDEAPSIIAEVRKLLSRDAHAGSFLVSETGQPLQASPVSIGDTVGGHFRITSELGRGGMGIVYRAQDLILSRPVALKFLGGNEDTTFLSKSRVIKEAQAAAGLNHPNICVIHETGEHHGQQYIVMELLEGKTLKQRIGREGLPLHQVLKWAAQITDGLKAAHEAGVIHRDIKPANIFITAQEQAKILDFGLAKSCAMPMRGSNQVAQLDLTGASLAVGTPPYMTPEHARGEVLDSRADLFSLGGVLYEMATGKRAFAGETTVSTLDAILYSTPKTPSHINPNIPTELDRIIFKALEKQREPRYQHAEELLEDLRSLQRATDRQEAPLHRSRLAISLIIAGALGVAVVLTWTGRNKPLTTPTEQQLTRNLPENRALGGRLSPDGKELVYVDLRGLHIKNVDTGAIRDVALPGEIKANLWDAAFYPDGKELLFITKSRPDREEIWVVPATGGVPRQLRDDVWDYATSPNGIVFTRNGGSEIWVVGLDGENPRKVLDTEIGRFESVTWSPTGQRIAYTKYETPLRSQWGGSIETVDIAGGDRRVVLSNSRLKIGMGVSSALAWSGDGRIIFVLKETSDTGHDEAGNLWAIRTNPQTGRVSGKAEKITNWSRIGPIYPSVSRDGTRMAVMKFHAWENIYIGELKDNGTRLGRPRRFTVSDSIDSVCSWTPNGKAILYLSDVTGQMQLFKKQVGQDTVQALPVFGNTISGCTVTPGGNWILYTTEESGGGSNFQSMKRMRISGGPTEQVFQFPSDGKSNWDCYPGSTGSCIYGRLEKGNIVFYSLDPLHGLGKELARTPGHGKFEFSVAPEGTRIAIRMGESIAVLDLRTRTERHIPVPPKWSLGGVAFTGDGKALNADVLTDKSYELVRIQLDGKIDILLDQGRNYFIGSPVPSLDGRYITFSQRTFEGNFWLLENF